MKKSENQPFVSIVMPVYNAGLFLACSIESILKQTYSNYELVIVDDVSTDNSWEIIQSYQKQHPDKIRAIRLKENTNAAGNGGVNAVYQSLKGEFVARMDADDIAHQERIKEQVKYLVNHPDTILVGTQGITIDAKGNITGKKTEPVKHNDIYKEFFVFHPILHPSVMIRKSLVPQKTYLYENKYGINDDYYTFFKFLQYGKFYNLPKPYLYYRIHGKNFSLQNPKQKFINSIKIRVLAITEFHYIPSVKSIILMAFQIPIVLLLPESWILPVYYFAKGITRPKFSWKKKIALQLDKLKQQSYNSKLKVIKNFYHSYEQSK